MFFYKSDGTPVEIKIGSDYEAAARERLTGKVLITLGDSYTAQMSTQLTALANELGLVLDNRGLSSSKISYRDGEHYRSFYTRSNEIVQQYTNGKTIDGETYHPDDVKVITIMGGANDGETIDTWIGTGVHETDITTIYGALNYILNLFQSTFQNATIIVITQPPNYGPTISDYITTDEGARGFGFDSMAEAYVLNDIQFGNYLMAIKENAVRDIAWLYHTPLLDMFHEFPSMLNPANRAAYWQSVDRTHLTAAGYNLLKDAIKRKIIELFGQ